MANGKIKVATCQFSVNGRIDRNARNIIKYMYEAKELEADMIHFPETALSGYAGIDYQDFKNFDWSLLREKTHEIMQLSKELNLWTVLGSAHRLTEPNLPHNSLYLINPNGEIQGRYDKRFCTMLDLKNFTPGNHFTVFDLNGVKCALLICFDLRFPELYRELYKLDVQFVIQSFYNARQKRDSVHKHIMRQTMQCRAATNHMWASMSNSSAFYSPYPSCFIQPDGEISGQLKFNEAGIMVNEVNLNLSFYDPSKEFRALAIAGELTNGPGKINDPRSINETMI